MIDRNGNYVVVAWQPHEILWVQAALELPIFERNAAYQDIAYMAGRSFQSVRAQAYFQQRKAYDDQRYAARRARLVADSTAGMR